MSEGISIRFIREYKAEKTPQPSMFDMAIALAATDERDIPFNERLKDALAFVKSRIH